jgi:hypothetical protein
MASIGIFHGNRWRSNTLVLICKLFDVEQWVEIRHRLNPQLTDATFKQGEMKCQIIVKTLKKSQFVLK